MLEEIRLAFHSAVQRGSSAEAHLLGVLPKFISSIPRPGEVALVVNHPDESMLSIEFRLIPGPETNIAKRIQEIRDFIRVEMSPLQAGVYTMPAGSVCPRVVHDLW